MAKGNFVNALDGIMSDLKKAKGKKSKLSSKPFSLNEVGRPSKSIKAPSPKMSKMTGKGKKPC